MGDPQQFRTHQDTFWAACGQPHGLSRGEPGSKARHVPVQKLYAAMNAGAEPPTSPERLLELPPAPMVLDHFSGAYADKKRARREAEAENERIRERNIERREKLLAQAEAGRMLSPELVERHADRYRQAVYKEKVAEQKRGEAIDVMAAASAAQAEADQALKQARQQLEQVQAGVEHIETAQFISTFDKIGKGVAPEYVAHLARELQLELVAGKGLIDQVRRGLKLTGPASSLEAIRLIDGAAENAGIETIGSATWTRLDRDPQGQGAPRLGD